MLDGIIIPEGDNVVSLIDYNYEISKVEPNIMLNKIWEME